MKKVLYTIVHTYAGGIRILIVTALLVCASVTAIAEDEIETIDGTVFKGKIIKEDRKSVYLKIKTGTVMIDRDMIQAVRMEESWGIEDHVERIETQQTDNDTSQLESQQMPDSGLIYFPLQMGSWWKYRVRYTPKSLYGEPLPDAEAVYELTWEITDQTRTNTLYFSQYAWHLPDLFQLSIHRDDRPDDVVKKILFVGSLEGDASKAFLVMVDESRTDRFFYQRLVPKNPFLKYTRQWADIGQEGDATFKSTSKIIGIEGIDTASGFFEDCLVIERTDEVENQTVISRFYIWYAPGIGMVKMIQEIVYPQVESGNLLKSYIFQEYDLLDYGVNE